MTYLVTINYNNSLDTIEFLTSLEQVKTDYKLIIIDNNSTIENFEKLRKYLENNNQTRFLDRDVDNFRFNPQIKVILIEEEKNLGFAGGNNHGILIASKQADFEGVILINNDTLVDPGFLDEIQHYRKQNKDADLIGCRIFLKNPKDVIWYDGGRYYRHFTRAVHINENKNIAVIPSTDTPHKTEFITGCFMYISRHCIEKIGLLDESLFMYNEDLEYCIRATKKGLSIYYVPTAVIWHKTNSQPDGKPSCFSAYWGARNRFRVSRLHSNTVDRYLTFIFYLLTRIPRFQLWVFQKRTDLIRAQTKGMIDGLRK